MNQKNWFFREFEDQGVFDEGRVLSLDGCLPSSLHPSPQGVELTSSTPSL